LPVRHCVVAVIALSFAGLLAACEDPNAGLLDPALVTDTVEIAAPAAGGPARASALDLTTLTQRFPEQASDAASWDLALRIRDGQIAFVPAGVFGLLDPVTRGPSRAGVTEPLTDGALETLREAPNSTSYETKAPIDLQTGSVYAARSRGISCGFTQSFTFAKFKVLSLDPTTGVARLAITVNRNCGDVRLVPVD
jgi:hypothetical protein